MVTTLWQDLRYALRTLGQSRGFATVAVVTLALGIGLNTAIFSVVDVVLLRPLPYKDSGRIVGIFEHDVRRNFWRNPISPFAFHFWRERAQSFEVMAAATPWAPVLTGRDRPDQMQGLQASATLFRLLGVAPWLGRTFGDEDGTPGNDHVIVLGHGLWQRRFGGDPAIVGRKLLLDGESYTVIGVMPPGFRFPPFWATEAEFWAPMVFSPQQAQSNSRHLRLFARLKPGVSVERAGAELATLAGQLVALRPREYAGLATNVESIHESTVHGVRGALLVLLGAVGFVLLIACANVANLLLVRGSARRRELAVRVALGAGRGRLVRQLLTESLLLAVAGGAAGWILARGCLSGLVALAAGSVPRLEDVSLDLRVLAFALGISALAALVAGLVPAWEASKVDLSESLKEAGRQSVGGGNRLRRAFIVAQMALALVLLTGAGLLLQTLHNLETFDPGFSRSNILTAFISLAGSRQEAPEQQNPFFDALLERVRALPGVESAGLVNHLPFGGDIWSRAFMVEGEPEPAPADLPVAAFRVATPGYFRTIGIRVLRGRGLSTEDTATSPPVVVVNETLVRRFLPGGDPIGRRIRLGGPGSQDPWRTVVGVIHDTRQWDLTDEPRPEFHFPYAQNPAPWWPITTLAVRSTTEAPALVRAIEAQVHAIDPSLPVSKPRTMAQILDSEVRPQRLNGMLVAAFAVLALVLAAVGIYGVIAFSVAQRTREIGLRMALGAQTGNILRLVVGQGLSLILLGVGLGLAVSYALARLLESFLFGVSAHDPLTFGGVALLLGVVALAACFIPARRAARVEPMVALRYE